MAYAALAVQQLTDAGLEAVYVALVSDGGDGHAIPNDGKTFIHIKNGTTAFGLTIITGFSQDGLALADQVIAIGTDEEWLIGPFPPGSFNQTSGTNKGSILLDYDDITDGTIAAVKL